MNKRNGDNSRSVLGMIVSLLLLGEMQAGAAEKEGPKLVPITPVPPGLQVSRLFNDHMVLQREKPVKVWGWADAGSAVKVSFGGQTKEAKADKAGRWVASLKAMEACSEGRELVVACGTNKVALKDVLVGEVWLLGGQSNMSFPLWVRNDGFTAKDAEAHPEYSAIRCVSTLHLEFADPPYNKLDWVQHEPQKELPFKRDWVVFGPQCIQTHAPSFSAFGFFFAKNLYEQLKVPVGLIDTSVGGTLAHYWAPGAEQKNIPGLEESYKSEFWFPGCLYNSTIWPIRDMAIRGAWFYLGENNSMTKPLSIFEPTYRAVIASWRKTFGIADMPFGIVQTASCGSGKNVYGPGPNNIVQEAQLRIQRTTPNTGIVITTDEVHGDLHIIKKQSHGERAVRWAMAEVYAKTLPRGEKPKTWGSPAFKTAEVKGDRLIVKLETMGGEGLKLTGTPAGFVVAGEDKKFYEAQAELVDKAAVAVWSDKVAKPVAARFGWSGTPYINLWTESGLPVSPFRTDDWE
ncbi:MAG: sialate O-acetylesterase [bacterium]